MVHNDVESRFGVKKKNAGDDSGITLTNRPVTNIVAEAIAAYLKAVPPVE